MIRLMNNELQKDLEGNGNSLREYLNIFLEGLKKTMKSPSQESQCSSKTQNEYFLSTTQPY
jgi:hypothetical protein